MDQTDETTSAPEINKQRIVEVKYGITLDTKQMTKVKELRLLHLYASVAIGINHVAVTELTRRETCGSKCKLFIIKHGQYRQGRAVANRYGMGKTQE